MPLKLETRFCWDVYIIQCKGSIVEGRALDLLHLALDQAVSEFRRLILEVRGVDHLDGAGMGLLVRYAFRLRKRGGDLRLAGLSPTVLARWKQDMLSRVLDVYPTEEDAIASFVRGSSPREAAPIAGRRVLVLDESADMCTFLTAVLTQLGFAVESATCFWDARILLDVDAADYILLGPDAPKLPVKDVAGALKAIAPQACVLQLDRDFKFRDSLELTEVLLDMFGTSALEVGAAGECADRLQDCRPVEERAAGFGEREFGHLSGLGTCVSESIRQAAAQGLQEGSIDCSRMAE